MGYYSEILFLIFYEFNVQEMRMFSWIEILFWNPHADIQSFFLNGKYNINPPKMDKAYQHIFIFHQLQKNIHYVH